VTALAITGKLPEFQAVKSCWDVVAYTIWQERIDWNNTDSQLYNKHNLFTLFYIIPAVNDFGVQQSVHEELQSKEQTPGECASFSKT
jgi:hypothetical protein